MAPDGGGCRKALAVMSVPTFPGGASGWVRGPGAHTEERETLRVSGFQVAQELQRDIHSGNLNPRNRCGCLRFAH